MFYFWSKFISHFEDKMDPIVICIGDQKMKLLKKEDYSQAIKQNNINNTI
jgi:hypothetical protein